MLCDARRLDLVVSCRSNGARELNFDDGARLGSLGRAAADAHSTLAVFPRIIDPETSPPGRWTD